MKRKSGTVVGRRRAFPACVIGALAVSLAIGAGTSGCEGRAGGVKGKSDKTEPLTGPALVELNLTRGAPEAGQASLFGPIPGQSYSDLVQAIQHIDKDAKGVFVRLGGANMSFAEAQEIGGLLASVRKRGLPVTCHAEEYQNGTLLLAARGCSEIWVSPVGGVEAVGIAAQLIFGKSLFDKLDVTVDFLQVGKYKGAEEPFTRDEPSPEARASLEGALHDLRNAWIAGVNDGRGKDVSDAIEDGPYTPEDAKAAGLVDAVGYLDEARNAAKTKAGAARTVVGFGGRPEAGGMGEVLRQIAGGDPTMQPHVAVVRAIGAITMGGGGGLLGGSDGITEEGLGRTISEVTDDDSVKAVVLRIDSPGGSALASDLLWHRLMQLRAKKPLVISIGGMAASGGYYLSCAGDRIFAEDTSIVGSIGVVGGKFSLKDSLAKIGVHVVNVPAASDPTKAARATYMSMFDSWDDATRAKMLKSMEQIYDIFLTRVSEGRKIAKERVAGFAEGQIFGGKTGLDKGLVDEIGGLSDAVAFALDKGGLGKDGAVVIIGKEGGLADLFGGGGQGDESAEGRLESRLEGGAKDAARRLNPLADLAKGLPPEALVWLESASPMSDGETALAALPYAIVLR